MTDERTARTGGDAGSVETERHVVVPGGPRPGDLVTGVRPGEAVQLGERGGLAATATDADNVNAPVQMVVTPGGYRHRSLVHPVDAGVALDVTADAINLFDTSADAILEELPTRAPVAAAIPALGSGWIAYAAWNNGTGTAVSSFSTTWRVPPPPAVQVPGEVIFLFNGIQNSGANFGILQPVLQWGVSGAGGGAYWSVASWYVTSGGRAFHTNLVQVNPGDTVTGVMTLTGHAGDVFSYTSEFQGIAGTHLPVNNIAELRWCNETLEAYGISSCENYPQAPLTRFTQINIRMGATAPAIAWTPINAVTGCGQHATVVSNSATYGEVDIHYSDELADREACVAGQDADDGLHVFGIGTDSGLWHIRQTDGGWSSWASLGGILTCEPDVGRNADGRLEVFARGIDSALWHIWQTAPSGGWSGWASLGGVIYGDPCVLRNSDGRLEAFVRGTDDALWHISQTAPGGGWSGWASLGGAITGEPVIVRNADGRLEVFARGTDDALWHVWQTAQGGGWSDWASVDGVISGDPSIERNRDGRLEVFVRGTDSALWHVWQTAQGGGWSDWASLDGVLTSHPIAGRNADGRLEVFARGTDSALWHIWQTAPGGGWSEWASLAGVITSTPVAGRDADGRLEVFARGTDSALWHVWQTAPGRGWSDWASLGGRLVTL